MEKVEKNDRLKILSQIAVPIPCNKDLNEMNGTDRSRFCDHCHHSAINLSALTQAEAAESIVRTDLTSLCIRYTTTADGSIQFRNKPQRSGYYATLTTFSAQC